MGGARTDLAVRPGDVAASAGFRMRKSGLRCWDLAGEIDFESAEAFRLELAMAFSGTARVEIGCRELRFIDIVGVRVLAEAALAAPSVAVEIVGAKSGFRRCWRLLGFESAIATVGFAE